MSKFRIFFIVVFLSLNSICHSFASNCNVDLVIDGDSLIISCQDFNGLVAIAGIDAPEISQPYGKEAKNYLKTLVQEKTIYIGRIDPLTKETKILLPGGKDLAARMIGEGYAWVQDRRVLGSNYLLKFEGQTKKKRIGLWADAAPEPPWQYRRRNHLSNEEKGEMASIIERAGSRGDLGSSNSSYTDCLKNKDVIEQKICIENVEDQISDKVFAIHKKYNCGKYIKNKNGKYEECRDSEDRETMRLRQSYGKKPKVGSIYNLKNAKDDK